MLRERYWEWAIGMLNAGKLCREVGAILRCIHSTFSLPLENASETLEGQRILIICGDHIYRSLVHGAATPT